MAKHLCTSCGRKLPGPVAFCPACEQPTVHASDAERLEWDLRRWRAHVDRAAAPSSNPSSSVNPTSVALAEAPALQSTVPAPASVMAPEPDPIRVETLSVVVEPEPELEHHNEFAYRSCVTCERTDWIVRTSRNEDGTWNYWCVRCSRAFKTDVRIAQALKPFLSAGAVLGGIVATSVLMLH